MTPFAKTNKITVTHAEPKKKKTCTWSVIYSQLKSSNIVQQQQPLHSSTSK